MISAGVGNRRGRETASWNRIIETTSQGAMCKVSQCVQSTKHPVFSNHSINATYYYLLFSSAHCPREDVSTPFVIYLLLWDPTTPLCIGSFYYLLWLVFRYRRSHSDIKSSFLPPWFPLESASMHKYLWKEWSLIRHRTSGLWALDTGSQTHVLGTLSHYQKDRVLPSHRGPPHPALFPWPNASLFPWPLRSHPTCLLLRPAHPSHVVLEHTPPSSINQTTIHWCVSSSPLNSKC